MPLVYIDVLRGHSVTHRRAILDGVHAALVECFKIPDRDRNQVLREHAADNFDRPPGRSDNFTVVQVLAFPGRSREAKRALFAAIVRNLQQAPASIRATCSLSFANRRSTIGASAAGNRPPASTWVSRSTFRLTLRPTGSHSWPASQRRRDEHYGRAAHDVVPEKADAGS